MKIEMAEIHFHIVQAAPNGRAQAVGGEERVPLLRPEPRPAEEGEQSIALATPDERAHDRSQNDKGENLQRERRTFY